VYPLKLLSYFTLISSSKATNIYHRHKSLCTHEKIRKVYKFIIALHSLSHSLARTLYTRFCALSSPAHREEVKKNGNKHFLATEKEARDLFMAPRPTYTHPSKWQRPWGAENLISSHYCLATHSSKIVSFRLIEFVSSQIALSLCVCLINDWQFSVYFQLNARLYVRVGGDLRVKTTKLKEII
jgi:hypothetical protein